MRSNMSGLLNPVKINHSNSFVLPVNEHSGTFNKNNEKIKILQLDLETSKDTIIKLRSELLQKNQEIKNLKYNNKGQKVEHQYTLKVIETALRLIDPYIFNKVPKEKDSNTATYNTINHEINGKEENNKNIKEESEKELNINISNLNKKNMKPNTKIYRTERSPKKLTILSCKLSKDFSYINSLQNKVNLLKELLIKKNSEIKEMQKTTNTENYSNLQDNFEKNYTEMESIKKQNELMKTKIEDMTNLLFMEKAGNKSLKSKLQVFQSNFKEYQENSEKKTIDLETKLFKAQEKERDCRIFHTRKAADLDEGERLKMAEKEIKTMKKDIENLTKEIENKKEEYENLNNGKSDLAKQVQELKETNNKLNSEYLNLCNNANTLKKTKGQLEKENKEAKNKFNKINNKFKDEQDKTEKIKQTLKNKEKEIILLKKEIEKLKQNNNFKDGTFFTSIGAKGKTKNDQLNDLDVNIDEELAEIEKKYNMLNEKENFESKKEELKNSDKKNKDLENIQKEKSSRDGTDKKDDKIIKEEDLKEFKNKEDKDDIKKKDEIEKNKKIEENRKNEKEKDNEEQKKEKQEVKELDKEQITDKKENEKNHEKEVNNDEEKIDDHISEELKTLREILQYSEEDLKKIGNKSPEKEIKKEETFKKIKDKEQNQKIDEQEKYENNDDFIDFDLNLDEDKGK